MGIPGSANPLLLAQQDTGYRVQRSIRLNAPDSAFLSRTPSSAGNRKTWTWSGWAKRSSISSGDYQVVFLAGTSNNDAGIRFNSDNTLEVYHWIGGFIWRKTTSQVFRDTSAWYHILVSLNTDESVAEDRVKLFVNGTRVTQWSASTDPSLSYSATHVNNSVSHEICRGPGDLRYFSGYLAEIHFIDGQALTPSSFTEVSATTGQLVPKAYTGSYGTNGFKLDFADNSAATAAALGKDTSGNNNHWSPVNLSITDGSVLTAGGGTPIYNTTDSHGTIKGSGTRTDANASSLVLAVPMEGANNGTTFTDESATIKGSGSAKTLTRFGDTITSTGQSKYYGSSGYFDGTGDYLSVAASNDFAFGSGNFTIECWLHTSNTSTCDIFGYFSGSRYFGFIVGNPYGLAPTAGTISIFDDIAGGDVLNAPGGTVSANVWTHIAAVRNGSDLRIYCNGVSVANKTTTATTFGEGSQALGIGRMTGALARNVTGYIQDFRVYKGVAKYTANFSVPSRTAGAGNDSLVDTPVSSGTDTGAGGEVRGNYATLNPLATGTTATLANGNLDFSSASVNAHRPSTVAIQSGKWYCEFLITGGASGGNNVPGIVGTTTPSFPGSNSTSYGYYGATGAVYTNSGVIATYATFTGGDVVSVAFDADSGKIWFAKNGTWQGSGNPGTGANPTATATLGTYFFAAGGSSSGAASCSVNFGQRPFAYTAPSGFKALCDTNLPTPTIARPSTVFDTRLYTGNGSTQNITGLGFSPDLVWGKARTINYFNTLQDTVRGAGKTILYSNTTDAENAYNQDWISSFTSDGFSLASGFYNQSPQSYVAWCWDAGSSTVTNTQGSITSTVRANASAGFSIVTYTGNGSAGATVGHGLNTVPGLLIVKQRSAGATNWVTWHSSIANTNYLLLNTTQASTGPETTVWNNTTPTSTVFTLGSSGNVNTNSATYVAYLWSAVAGHSSFGSYTGNGSADGPFIYTGFRPRWLMIKRSSSAEDWKIYDTARDTHNPSTAKLYANLSAAENGSSGETASTNTLDVLSNGFKLRTLNGGTNQSPETYVWAAFAEAPFQYARAR